MRLLCPFCQKAITVPDSEAGKAVNCPECGQQFAAPQLYAPASPGGDVVTTPTPPVQPPRPSEMFPPAGSYQRDRDQFAPAPPELPTLPPAELELSGYSSMKSLALDPKVLRWVPPVGLTLVFFLTFLPWVGMYPAGYSAYTQNAWQCAFAGFSYDPVAELEFKAEKFLNERLHSNWWLIPSLLLLLPATLVVAWAGPIVELGKIDLPPAVKQFWQFRPAVLGALVVIMLLFLLAQWASGFGLRRAVREKAEETHAKEKAEAKTPQDEQRWEIKVASDIGAHNLKTTLWLRLAVLMLLLAVLAVVAEAGIQLRGQKPPPRIGVMW
jgi:Na+-transporting methylmalonyl-CoA/oxaloacetate decarboxylase gamma subunit